MLLVGGGPFKLPISVMIAVITVCLMLMIAVRYGQSLSRFAAHESDEIILLTTFGTVMVVAGVARRFHVSAAIGAFLVGIAVSGSHRGAITPAAGPASRLVRRYILFLLWSPDRPCDSAVSNMVGCGPGNHHCGH